MVVCFVNGNCFNSPTYVLWLEDMNGNYKRSLFITESYASGIFSQQMVGDSIWLNEPGSSFQPAALPYWAFKRGQKNMADIPTPENPFIDAYTCATPEKDFCYETTCNLTGAQCRVLLEVNQCGDWNRFWTNRKYLNSPEYKHSAQPSIIYSATINKSDTIFHLNPIGHGDPKGESGRLFTNLGTLTSAKEIFKSITIEVSR